MYNYKRPHQGIGGLCPADRFFEIDTALKMTLEKGVEENALELALRGEPRDPFYMVGRMGYQSVVICAEKGQVKMLVEDQKELVYDATKGADDESQTYPKGVRPETKDHRRTVHLYGAKDISQICAEMQVSRTLVDRWQNQAMEGMLAALSPKRAEHPRQLNPHMVQLIDKKIQGGTLVKLEKRLKTIQKKAN